MAASGAGDKMAATGAGDNKMAATGSGAETGRHHIRVDICIDPSSARAGEKRSLEERIEKLEEEMEFEETNSDFQAGEIKELRGKLSELEKRPIAKSCSCKRTIASFNCRITELKGELDAKNRCLNRELARHVEHLAEDSKALRREVASLKLSVQAQDEDSINSTPPHQ